MCDRVSLYIVSVREIERGMGEQIAVPLQIYYEL